jgi:hypothetical protein
LVEKPEGKRPSGTHRRKREDNIKTDFREIGYRGVVWIYLAQERPVMDSCEHGNELSGSIKCWGFIGWLSNCWLLKKYSAPGS